MNVLGFSVTVALTILVGTVGMAQAGALGGLDAGSRRLVREAELEGFGGQQRKSQNDQPGVSIQNQVDEFGRKKCIVSAGQVVTGKIEHGGRVENRTIVTGNIINVCQ